MGMFLLLGYFCVTNRKWSSLYEKYVQKEQKKTVFDAGVFILLKQLREKMGWRLQGERLEYLKKLHAGQGEEQLYFLYYGRIGRAASVIVLAVLFFIAVSNFAEQKSQLLQGYFLEREAATGRQKTVSLTAVTEDEERDVQIAVPPKQYSDEECTEKLQEAEDFIFRNYLGENSCAEQITQSLNLVSSIPDSAVSVSWDVGTDGLINSDGTVENDDLEESCQTQVTALLSYGETQKKLPLSVTILPRQRTKEELFWKEWQKKLDDANQEQSQDTYLELPDEVAGKKLSYREKQISISGVLLLALFVVLCLLPRTAQSRLCQRLKKREEEMRLDYPEFAEHFVLLIGAGLTVRGAWERIVLEYQKRRETEGKQYVYEEMLLAVHDMENGMSERQAYELFGKRTGILSYMKFSTLLVQNLRKGTEDLLRLLDFEVADAFEERKENAKAIGEKAGTRLLMPMMLMLVIVFVLILYSAFQSM